MHLAGVRKTIAVGFTLLVGLATLVPPPATARWPAGPWDFDVVGVSVNPSTVTQGNAVTLTVFIKNVGTEIGTVKVYAGIEKPGGIREYLAPHTIFDILVGQTRSTSWSYSPSAGSGQYKVDFDVYSPPENHMFDTTGFGHSFSVVGSPNNPTATRSSPPSSSVSLQEGDSQTFVSTLSDADCDLLYAEWYLEPGDGFPVAIDTSPEGCSSTTSWTHTFDSTGTFEVTVVAFDSRNDGSHVGRASWTVVVGPENTGGNTCSKSGTSLSFSGYEWEIRSGSGGPGPNTWNPDNVWCDAQGHLHLQITNQGGTWTTAQVTTTALGFGSYEFKVSGDALDGLDPRVVLGLFNYAGPDGTNEIDIEFSKWGIAGNAPGQYVVYPAAPGLPLAMQRFAFDQIQESTTHRYFWQSNRVSFESLEGIQPPSSWTFSPPEGEAEARIPQEPMPLHINLWLYQGQASPNFLGTEIVIESFSWQPEAMPASLRVPLPPIPPLG